MNLNIHFAIGNFIKDAMENRDIIIKGDGRPLRSYLYTADLVIWLLTMLLKSENKSIYNVGGGGGGYLFMIWLREYRNLLIIIEERLKFYQNLIIIFPLKNIFPIFQKL